MYDYVVVGAGLTGSVIAHELTRRGSKVLVIEARDVAGGNCADEFIDGFPVCKYGGHIFHTNSDRIWKYMNNWIRFIPYKHRVQTMIGGTLYPFPINLNTMEKLWGVKTESEAKERLAYETRYFDGMLLNDDFESYLVSRIGVELYHKFYYGYTLKQWGKLPSLLPASIAKRVPVRFDRNDDYFDSKFQAMPARGYNYIFEILLDGIEVKLNTKFEKTDLFLAKNKLIHTGPIDEYFDYMYGELEYRGIEHEQVEHNLPVATMNLPELSCDQTRAIDFNYFYGQENKEHHITVYERPTERTKYYPIRDGYNLSLYNKYKEQIQSNVRFCGRLGSYQYLDMDQAIGQALAVVEDLEGVK